jgi:hypothetical protein
MGWWEELSNSSLRFHILAGVFWTSASAGWESFQRWGVKVSVVRSAQTHQQYHYRYKGHACLAATQIIWRLLKNGTNKF